MSSTFYYAFIGEISKHDSRLAFYLYSTMLAHRLRSRTCKKVVLAAFSVCFLVLFVFLTMPGNETSFENSFVSFNELRQDFDADLEVSADIQSLRNDIKIRNERQVIFNQETFDPQLTNDSIIIVVQVHKRITYLRHLIVSLAQARDISKTLLILSHDFYDEEINELVQSIDFCKVMQIFYPFSIQTHPNEFPGTDPKDCKRDMKKEQALVANCQNAHYPDLYGHYREASFTQTKHHWWWKANRVFDQLEVTRHHTGLVLFLEEDHYLAEDFLHSLKAMQIASVELCPTCNIFSLGTYKAALNNANFDKVDIAAWISSQHNMGMSFDRTTWNEIKSCAEHFCGFDDYNWDWSLQHTSYKCLKRKLHVAFLQGPRVFHIGECGMHHAEGKCELKELSIVKTQLSNAKSSLFPKTLRFSLKPIKENSKDWKANGGWSDPRDKSLCLSMTKA